MEGDIEVLRLFYRLGVRMIQLRRHDTTNSLVDAYAGEAKWSGISARGRAVIQEMNRLGIIIDISHSSELATRQVIQASQAPVVNSLVRLQHFAKVIWKHQYSLIDTLALRQGMIGLHSAGHIISQKAADWSAAQDRLKPRAPKAKHAPEPFRPANREYGDYIAKLDEEMRLRWVYRWNYGRPWRELQREASEAGAPLVTPEEWAEQIQYVVKRVGADHIGLGLGLMAGGNWLRDFDATRYPRLTEAMLARGMAPDVVRKVLGENWLRLLDEARVR